MNQVSVKWKEPPGLENLDINTLSPAEQDNFGLSKNLASHWRSRHRQLGPGDEYDLVDECADMNGLRGWYEWKLDTGKE
jgi:hypothetical protein